MGLLEAIGIIKRNKNGELKMERVQSMRYAMTLLSISNASSTILYLASTSYGLFESRSICLFLCRLSVFYPCLDYMSVQR